MLSRRRIFAVGCAKIRRAWGELLRRAYTLSEWFRASPFLSLILLLFSFSSFPRHRRSFLPSLHLSSPPALLPALFCAREFCEREDYLPPFFRFFNIFSPPKLHISNIFCIFASKIDHFSSIIYYVYNTNENAS